MKRVVLYSGGLVSWRVADLVIAEHGTENVTLLFCDTSMEDADLYRFLDETSAAFGLEVTTLRDGRTPWEVFRDERYLGNTRADPCSRVLKREPTRRWLQESCNPGDTVVYLGFDMFEDYRFRRALEHWQPWTIKAPLVERLENRVMLEHVLRSRGIEPPRMYAEGFSHNNCGGFCIKAGIGHFSLLLEARPEEYARHEAEEQALREHLEKDVAILRDRSGGELRPLTLRELRERIEQEDTGQLDLLDVRGCGCFAEVGS